MIICYVSQTPLWLTLIAFFCIQLQGTLYNYYYVILRNKLVGGDATSRIFEHEIPKALHGENQEAVTILFKIYMILYGSFDKIIHYLDADAYKVKSFPNWFMTFLSIYGLGFQLLIMAIMLSFGLIEYLIPYYIITTTLLFLLISIRKKYIH